MDYNDLKKYGRKLLEAGELEECFKLFDDALRLNPEDERIRKKVKTLREALEERDQDGPQNDSEMVEVCPEFYLHTNIHSRLFEYQIEGLRWMFSLYKSGKGGVLGDDMGLGKTVQVVSFLAGLFDMELISSVLLIMPVSLIGNWAAEFEKWAPGILVYDFHSGTKKEKEVALRRVMSRGGVLITTYGMVTTRHEELCTRGERKFVWDYVVLDEGHRIKNPTKTQKAIFGLLAKHRLILTGTPVQNNLCELWSLFHFTHQGTLFGNRAGFRLDFEQPINRGREKDAKPGEREMGVQLALQLKKMIEPFFLRRTKAEVFRNGQGPKVNVRREDLVLWTFLSETQEQLYRDFLESDSVKEILLSSKSPLVQLNILKKICDHPRLLPKRACVQLGLCDTMTDDEVKEFLEDDKHCPFTIDDISEEDLINESGKMRLLVELVTNLRSNGHRALVFSTSRRILDIIQKILRSRDFTISRLDGHITKHAERNQIVNDFQTRGRDVFLLTTQVGGVGLTLTNADRVIIYDPNWNPATDAQAVDRAFRIGQKKDVIVYRLITCGTLEEKIYSRQIFKDSIIKQTTGNQADPTRYFTRSQLRELFVLADARKSETQQRLTKLHWKEVNAEVANHITFLMSTKLVFGVSHHDLLFSTEDSREAVSTEQINLIKQRVERARVLREREAEIVMEDLRENPHIVPELDGISAAARNQALMAAKAALPEDIYNELLSEKDQTRHNTTSDFIDLSQELTDDEDVENVSKRLHSTAFGDGLGAPKSNEVIVLDEGSDDEISVIKVTKTPTSNGRRSEGKALPMTVQDSNNKYTIEDVSNRHSSRQRDPSRRSMSSTNADDKTSSAKSGRRSARLSVDLTTAAARDEGVVRPKKRSNSPESDYDSEASIKGHRRRRPLVIASDDDEIESVHSEDDAPVETRHVKDINMVDNATGVSSMIEGLLTSPRKHIQGTTIETLPPAGGASKARDTLFGAAASNDDDNDGGNDDAPHADDIGLRKKKRQSVATARRSDSATLDSALETRATNSVSDETSDGLGAIEAAYDKAFEHDDVDESIIEQTILETSLLEAGDGRSSNADSRFASAPSSTGEVVNASVLTDESFVVEESVLIDDNDDDDREKDQVTLMRKAHPSSEDDACSIADSDDER